MADPLETLRTPQTPVDPDPAFTSRLRDRLQRVFDLPKGVTVSNLTLDEPTASALSRPEPTSSVIPYLAVAGAQRAIEWYATALGAELHGEPIVMPDGRIGHAQLDVQGGLIMLSEEHPEIGVSAPVPGQGAPVTIHLTVPDVDAIVNRAVTAGAQLDRAVADYDYGRNGVIKDPFGHRWLISGHPAAVGPRHGDIGYASLWVPDVERAATFFSTVLGWRYAPARNPQSRQVEGLTVHQGMWEGGEPRSTLFLCFAVDNVDDTVDRVRQAGGTAADPTVEPYGRLSECVDDQGVPFAVYEPPGGVATGAPSLPNGARQGDLAYITMEVEDSARTRSFYGEVLGWRFTMGRVDDGWQVEDTAPMTGLHGGHAAAMTVPMYRVDDIDAAVGRVRQAGGMATDPEVHPYGTTSDCVDDQGTRFYLGLLS